MKSTLHLIVGIGALVLAALGMQHEGPSWWYLAGVVLGALNILAAMRRKTR
jgi:hypothetical protein